MSTTQTPTNTDEMNRKLHEAAVGEHELHCPNCSIPAYDQNLKAAFELVEWMRKEKGFQFEFGTTESGGWNVEVWQNHQNLFNVYDKSLPKAIALACYLALENES